MADVALTTIEDMQVGRWNLNLPLLALGTLLALVCLALGFWQSQRMYSKQEQIAEIEGLARAEAVDVTRLGANWRRFTPVSATGFFVEELALLLDNRIYSGRAGYEVYNYFAFARPTEAYDGIWVNRGWREHSYPRAAKTTAVSAELARIEGIADLPELWRWQEPAASSLPLFVSSVDLARFDALAGVRTPPYALKLDAGQFGALARLRDNVFSVSPERHLGYAVQWFGLALVLILGMVAFHWRS